MGGAEEYLPAPFKPEEIQALLDTISLGRPTSINSLKASAAFHAIYILTYEAKNLPAGLKTLYDTSSPFIDLVLRISGDHVPAIKTENEAATLSWISQHTSIPVPSVICYDTTTNNPLNREYIVLTRSPGVTLSDVYDSLTQEQLDDICRQLLKFLAEIHQHSFAQIGGLMHSPTNPENIISGPILDEHFWFTPDVKRYFTTTDETFETLNIRGPFTSYTNFTIALMEKYIHAASVQKDLTFMRQHLPRLRAFCNILPTFAAQLDRTRIRLAHKDLHFANMLYDPSSNRITGILDWEFASTVPFQIWDPVRAFLWNAKPGDESYTEKYRLRDRFAEICREEDAMFLVNDAKFTSDIQEKMHNVSNMMRIIVTLIPRGQFVDRAPEFVKTLLENLEAFGV
ncbi:hypothetical protein UA08_07313 [Talaromyces atroroseus]|uniref:Aminoglycoside phosphotransferase domain-containing protein n=1 Tax=Talaromyces atroroseus TaxID=1441469 RepID=A0A225AT83_TALAT|nr:hypothetical protein UA08_07313 [Talaromyces atroroseus]OKL57625.1 hypothetical protein UA08_07313 [Talaromyces atroroseus]